ncbi:MAG: aspartate aminotransferase family protein [Cyclobacteriaceae bacterium]|nr:aspartate aminotransferase family protein [Cyclobacteriaceae bacterium]
MNDHSPLNMDPSEFKRIGHQLVDQIASFLEELPSKKVTSALRPGEVQQLLGFNALPEYGSDAESILTTSAQLLFDHSLFNGHPRFWGYITSSATPIGVLSELLAASVNPNVGAFILSPMATEIERQTVQWLAEMIGYTPTCGGLFVSGGNMANLVGFLAARRHIVQQDIRKIGLADALNGKRGFTLYCAQGTHTWINKAADLFGHGTDAIRWIELTDKEQIDVTKLEDTIESDLKMGYVPFLVVGNAGSVGTGVIDPLQELAAICKKYNLWFHVDGAYGAPAAALPELAASFKGLSLADSIALDPHKWLYAPLEAGCILVRDAKHLHDAFTFNPDYYNFDGDLTDKPVNFHEYGMQNSRGFRALKVWTALRQAGRSGYISMIRKDIELARYLAERIASTPRLELVTVNLSIVSFRFIPEVLPLENKEKYLNTLNEKILNRLQTGGQVFISNAVVKGRYCLRMCIVNFRTTQSDLDVLVRVVLEEGDKLLHSQPLEN